MVIQINKQTKTFQRGLTSKNISPSFDLSDLSDSGLRAGDCFDTFAFLSIFPVA